MIKIVKIIHENVNKIFGHKIIFPYKLIYQYLNIIYKCLIIS